MAGILYGAAHQSRLSKREVKIREVEEKQRAVRDAKLAAEKKISLDQEMASLAAMAGGKL